MLSLQTRAIHLWDKNQTCVCACAPGTGELEQTASGAWMISRNRIIRHLALECYQRHVQWPEAHLAALDQLLLGSGVLVGHGRVLGGGDGLRGSGCSLLGCHLERRATGGEPGFECAPRPDICPSR